MRKLAFAAVLAALSLTALGSTASAATPLTQPPAAERPVMGYNTWYEFGANITENRVLTQARALVSSGLAAAGYTVVTLDDGWQSTRAVQRRAGQALNWNVGEFPDGIPFLARQLAAMGLKLGIYTAAGKNTCTDSGALAGSYGHYAQDAATFRSWGVSFVKVDSCGGLPRGTSVAQLTADFRQFGGYIRGDGMTYSEELPVLLPVGSAGYLAAVRASAQFADMWRVAPDESPLHSSAYIVLTHLADDLSLYPYASWGHWNDLDMLVPGPVDAHPFNWSLTQEKSQLAVWAMEASPLILSTDVPTLTAAETAALANRDMIAVDQSGSQASHGGRAGAVRYLYKGADGGMAVMLANTGTATVSASLPVSQVGIRTPQAVIRTVWGGTVTSSRIRVTLADGQAALFVLSPAA